MTNANTAMPTAHLFEALGEVGSTVQKSIVDQLGSNLVELPSQVGIFRQLCLEKEDCFGQS
jgi:hypothetical protein